MPGVVRWTLWDPTANETYTFGINPNEGGSPSLSKSLSTQSTAAPDGRTILFEGRDQPQKIEISGVLLDEIQLNTLQTWFGKRHQIRVTDDLGRQYWVYITDFTPTRGRRANYPFYHTYKLQMTVVDYP
jgi:hypothetical protein